jgi:peptidoglycan biosynthesis protein MviN/MurJ (putative lipid II flippase)
MAASVLLVGTAWLLLPTISGSAATQAAFHSVLLAGSLLPVVAAVSGVFSGSCAALGRFGWVTVSQGFRPLGGLTALAIFGDAGGVSAVAAGLVLGEVARAVALSTVFRRGLRVLPPTTAERAPLRPFLGAAASQISSMVIIGLNPLVDKTIASTIGVGAITVLELAEKLFYVPVTLVSSGVGTVLGARWANAVTDPAARRGLRRDFWRAQVILGAFGLVTALVLVGAVWVVQAQIGDALAPTSGRTFAIAFSCYAIGLPAALGNNVGFRVIVALRASHLLVVFAAAGLVANVVFDLVGAHLLGVYGIALGSSGYRLITCGLIYFAADRLMRVPVADVKAEELDPASFAPRAVSRSSSQA